MASEQRALRYHLEQPAHYIFGKERGRVLPKVTQYMSDRDHVISSDFLWPSI